MRIAKLLSAIVLIAASNNAATAGGLDPVVMDAPLAVPIQTVAPQGSSINSAVIVVGVLAALLIAAASSADD